jgi:hypothetical protein
MWDRKDEADRRGRGEQQSTNGQRDRFYREYKCDNCGYPEGGHAKVFGVNKEL